MQRQVIKSGDKMIFRSVSHMNSEDIYRKHGQEVYLFILKRVKNQDIANDIFQSVFFKVHKNIGQLKTHQKSRGWVFQIGRNEIANYFNNESTYQDEEELVINDPSDLYADVCCFDRFINGLPDMYREVMVLTYISGKKQDEVAKALGI
ncbi:MAG: sigma-70 family RNA polymerase sigma factor, partial [Bacteroidota bacterium]